MNSIEDLRNRIKSVRDKIGCTDPKHEPFFRGHPIGNYTLTPALFRVSERSHAWRLKAEANVFAEFVSRAPRGILTDASNSWMRAAAMQHYGIPTRLLDWTTSLGVALYFALHPANGRLDLSVRDRALWPSIWVLNPWDLNDIAVGKRVVFDEADTPPFDYYESAVAHHKARTPWPCRYPIAIQPGWANDRIVAQKGCFTCHGSDLRPLEEIVKDESQRFWHLKRVPIPPSAVKNLRKSLSELKASHYDIYPDAVGYSMLIRERYNL